MLCTSSAEQVLSCVNFCSDFTVYYTWADPEDGTGCPDNFPPEKTQVAIGFLRNSGKDPLKKQLDPGQIASGEGRSVWPSLKIKRCQESPSNDGLLWTRPCCKLIIKPHNLHFIHTHWCEYFTY